MKKFLFVFMATMLIVFGWEAYNKAVKPHTYALDLPEEFSEATPTDTMNAVLDNDTLYITFRGTHK